MNVDPFDIETTFEEKAIQVFEYQRENNLVYQKFCKALGIQDVQSVDEIPLLPIQAFKDAEIITDQSDLKFKIQNLKYFESSGTSGMQRSRHYLLDPNLYKESLIKGMSQFYDLDNYVIWAYTPGYDQNPHSSLISMLDTLIGRESSGFSRFLEVGKPILRSDLEKVMESGKRLMLFGAAFGLMDIVEQSSVLPPSSIIIETGGMKTYRREMTRTELHSALTDGFGLPEQNIHSEYGMTELLSQAYSLGDEWFECVPWMGVSIRDPQNPMNELENGEEGLIGVIDLANQNSCSFILTGDKGVKAEDGRFKVLGRWHAQNLRGCNFLIDKD